MLRLNLSDYRDGYIVVKGEITVKRDDIANKRHRKLIFKNNVTIRSCISKTNNAFTDSPKDLHSVMPMYNSLEYSDSYSIISGDLWNYFKDEENDAANENNDANIK